MNRRSQLNHIDKIQNILRKRNPSSHIGELQKSIHSVLHVKWLLPLSIAAGLLIGFLIFQCFTFPGWQTDAALYIQITKDQDTDYQMSIEEALSYSESILTRDQILQQVKENLNTDISLWRLRQMISFEKETSSPVLTILVTSENAEQSEKIANEILKIGLNEIPNNCPNLIPSILESASAKSAYQVSSQPLPYLRNGFLAGFLMPFILCYAITFIQNTFDSGEEVVEILQLPVVWEMDPKSEESINHFCGSYILVRPKIKSLCFIQMTSAFDRELIQNIGDCFKLFGQHISIGFFNNAKKDEKVFGNLNHNGKNNRPELSEAHDYLYIDSIASLDKNMIAIAKNCDDVILVLEKSKTKRSHALAWITELQESGVTVSGGLFITKNLNDVEVKRSFDRS